MAKPKPVAAGIRASDLAVTPVRSGGGRLGRIVIDGHRVMAAGDHTVCSTDGEHFYRRSHPGCVYSMIAVDGAFYSCGGYGGPVSRSRDFATTWKTIDVPERGRAMSIYRDGPGAWWIGLDEQGGVLTSKRPDRGWKRARFSPKGKTIGIVETAGKLFFIGADTGVWDGKTFRRLRGVAKGAVLTRVTESPAGTLIAIGDAGVAYRSTDRGATFQPIKSGVTVDIEDCAWVAGALFAVGGNGLILRSTNDGQRFTKVPSKVKGKLWSIASWGDGALIAGEGGVILRLAAPGDPYWDDATDELVPPKPAIDTSFEPRIALAVEDRERTYRRLLDEAVALSNTSSAALREGRAADANPALAQLVDDQADDDTTATQIYTDWLQGEGDPRGELAAIQLKLATAPGDKKLKQAEKHVFARHADRLLGKLAAVQDLVRLEWRAGFMHTARVANSIDRSELYDGEKEPLDIEKLVGSVLDDPGARFLRELVVGIVTYEDNSYAGIAKLLGKRYLPALRSLYLGDFDGDETELSWSELGNLQPIYAAAPNLRRLKLRSGSMTLGAIVLPHLEELEVLTGGLDPKAAKAIASGRWPGLRRLSIQVGSPRYGGTAKASVFQPILDGVGLPRLEHLGLANLEFTDPLVELLAHAKILPQLSSVDLEMGTMSDEGARLFYRYQKAFRHLKTIAVGDNYVTGDGVKLLKSTKLRFDLGEQRDDEGAASNRYAAVAE